MISRIVLILFYNLVATLKGLTLWFLEPYDIHEILSSKPLDTRKGLETLACQKEKKKQLAVGLQLVEILS